jgi:hypothetical protein
MSQEIKLEIIWRHNWFEFNLEEEIESSSTSVAQNSYLRTVVVAHHVLWARGHATEDHVWFEERWMVASCCDE